MDKLTVKVHCNCIQKIVYLSCQDFLFVSYSTYILEMIYNCEL